MEISLTNIYKFGILCMTIIALANIWGLTLKTMDNAPMWVLIVSFGGVMLNVMFGVLFWYLAYKMPQQQEIPEDLKDTSNLKEIFKNG